MNSTLSSGHYYTHRIKAIRSYVHGPFTYLPKSCPGLLRMRWRLYPRLYASPQTRRIDSLPNYRKEPSMCLFQRFPIPVRVRKIPCSSLTIKGRRRGRWHLWRGQQQDGGRISGCQWLFANGTQKQCIQHGRGGRLQQVRWCEQLECSILSSFELVRSGLNRSSVFLTTYGDWFLRHGKITNGRVISRDRSR